MEGIAGTGIDLIEIERIKEVLKRHGERFLLRIFTEKERAYCEDDVARLAARFAAKEAVAKSLGVGIGEEVGWQDIEILNHANGSPYVTLSKSVMESFHHPTIHLSMSHSRLHATAVAIRVCAKIT